MPPENTENNLDNLKNFPVAPTPTAPTVNVATVNNDAITSEALKPQPTVEIPTQEPPKFTPTQNVAEIILKESQVEDTATQKQASTLSQAITNLLPQLEGETAALAQAKVEAGLPDLNKNLQSINSQILKLQAELGQDDVQLVARMRAEERRDTLLPFAQSAQAKLAGDAAIMRALKASEIGVLNARAIGLQGDIQLARQTAEDAVALKYAPYKERISTYKAQLEALAPILSKDEAQQARKQTIKANAALSRIEKEEAEELRQVIKKETEIAENAKEKRNMILTLQKNGAPQSIIDQALSLQTVDEIQSIPNFGTYLLSEAEKLDMSLKRAQIAKIGFDIEQARNETDATDVEAMDKDVDFKKLKSSAELKNSLTKYQLALSEYGGAKKGSSQGAILDARYQEVLQAYRAAKDLGALQGADLSLVESAIKPATFDSRFRSPIEAIKAGRVAKQSVAEALKIANENITKSSEVIGQKNPSWLETPYYQTIAGGDSALQIDENGNIVVEGGVDDTSFWK